jgi:transcriptional regulator with XRE-family HTH domain
MNNKPPLQVFGPAINRFGDVMAHTDRYAFSGISRLAMDARVSASSVSRLLSGKMNPSFLMVARLVDALERHLGYSIDPRDLIAESGRFRTLPACTLIGCKGCLPENAYDEFGSRKAAFADVKPGTWVTSRYPKGYGERKEVDERK